jgi:hypothetical protein
MMNWEGFGKKQLWPNEGTVLDFIWKVEEDYKNCRQNRIASGLAKIQMKHLQK